MDERVAPWLAGILKERFGGTFVLELGPAASVLRIPGSEGRVVFDEVCPALRSPGAAPHQVWWAAEEEGWASALGDEIPAPGGKGSPGPWIEAGNGEHRVHYDLPGLIWWALSRAEEVGRTDLDRYGRFPASASHAVRYGYLHRPVVDEWLHILRQVIRREWPNAPLHDHAFSVRVSHDVDTASRYAFTPGRNFLRRMAGDLVRRRDPGSFLRAPWIRVASGQALHPRDPANTFPWIMDESERRGLTSAFYFMCGRTDAEMDADYEIESPPLRRLIREIHLRGHEVGLHPSFGTYRDPGALAEEADRLRKVCREEEVHQSVWGGRMHFLRWEQPTTLRAWAEAGLDYDSTLGYADQPGFRCGTCFEYPAFDPVAGKALGLRIRPLVAMECSVIAEAYLGLGTGPEARAVFRTLKDACRAVGGCFTLLWHNSALDSRGDRELYRWVLDA